MIKIVAKMPVKAGEVDNFVAAAQEIVEKSRKDAGNHVYTLNVKQDDPQCITFIEFWEDQAAIDAHNATEHFQRIFPQLCALCDGDPIVELYDELI